VQISVFLSSFVLHLSIKQLHGQTFRIGDILWYFHNEVTWHPGRRNFRLVSRCWYMDNTKRCKRKEDSVKSEWTLKNFWKIGQNYSIFKLGQLHPTSSYQPSWPRRSHLDPPVVSRVCREILVTLAFTGIKCIKNTFEKFENFQHFFKKWGESNLAPFLDLPLNLRICCRKFRDSSSYRNEMYKKQF
jgi:hypothetical protein